MVVCLIAVSRSGRQPGWRSQRRNWAKLGMEMSPWLTVYIGHLIIHRRKTERSSIRGLSAATQECQIQNWQRRSDEGRCPFWMLNMALSACSMRAACFMRAHLALAVRPVLTMAVTVDFVTVRQGGTHRHHAMEDRGYSIWTTQCETICCLVQVFSKVAPKAASRRRVVPCTSYCTRGSPAEMFTFLLTKLCVIRNCNVIMSTL